VQSSQPALFSCVKLLALALCLASLPASLTAETTEKLMDFTKEKEIKMEIVDDGVMGGRSQGKVKRSESGSLLFRGRLSLENNGGFSSLRIDTGTWDLAAWTGLELKVKGDGRTYNLRLTTDARHRNDAVSFQAGFPTTEGEWTVVRVPFSKLKASWRGNKLDTKFDAAEIEEVGVILADKKPGDFALEIESISSFK